MHNNAVANSFKPGKLIGGQYNSASELFWTCYGQPESQRTVVYLHGFPGSRLEAGVAHHAALTSGLKLLSIDRPGFGKSPHKFDHTLQTWPRRIEILLDDLKLEKVALLAVSGGTPYGISLAAALPQRISSLSVVSGLCPLKLGPGFSADLKFLFRSMTLPNRLLLNLGCLNPWLVIPVIAILGLWWKLRPRDLRKYFSLILGPDDKRILAKPETGLLLQRNIIEAFRPGLGGAIQEFKQIVKIWNVNVAKVECPVIIWHGDADTYVPVVSAQILAKLLSGAELKIIPDAGHFMVLERLPEIIGNLKFNA